MQSERASLESSERVQQAAAEARFARRAERRRAQIATLSLRDLISGFLADRDRAAVRRELLESAARHRDSRRISMS